MKKTIGIDLGGMSAKAGLLEGETLLAQTTCKTSALDSPEETARNLSRLALDLLEREGVDRRDCVIGVGSPGVIDSARGVVVNWWNFGWKDVALARLVSEGCGMPVFVTNDANAAALGEAKFGSGKRYADSILVTLGTGVGGGIVLNGKLFEGFRSAGGEIGHMVLRTNGVPCACGRRGCFECYASATALKRMTKEAMLRHPESVLRTLCDPDSVSGKTAFEGKRLKDAAATRVVSRYIGFLAEGIANLVNLFRPQAIILGGGVSNEGEELLAPLRRAVWRRIYAPRSYAPLEIVRASLGNDAGMFGAAAYAEERSFE